MWHDTGTSAWVTPASLTVEPLGHIENAEGKRRIHNLVEVSGLIDHLVQLRPRMATEDEVLRLHTREYVNRIKKASGEMGGDAGDLTPFGHGSYDIALLAAAGGDDGFRSRLAPQALGTFLGIAVTPPLPVKAKAAR